jgi:hypothetical protein
MIIGSGVFAHGINTVKINYSEIFKIKEFLNFHLFLNKK